jgi:hypothetical protein
VLARYYSPRLAGDVDRVVGLSVGAPIREVGLKHASGVDFAIARERAITPAGADVGRAPRSAFQGGEGQRLPHCQHGSSTRCGLHTELRTFG